MLTLTKKVDYALIAIHFIASQEEGFVANTKTLSSSYNIPLEMLAKILQQLVKEGMIVSQSGPRGGYLLAKELSHISVGEVIRATEGPIYFVHCADGDHVCSQMEQCVVKSPLQMVGDKIVAFLDTITLDQLYHENLSRRFLEVPRSLSPKGAVC